MVRTKKLLNSTNKQIKSIVPAKGIQKEKTVYGVSSAHPHVNRKVVKTIKPVLPVKPSIIVESKPFNPNVSGVESGSYGNTQIGKK